MINDLLDGSYFKLNIEVCFDYIVKNFETESDNVSIRIYVKKIEKRITFKIMTRYYLDLLTPETLKLLGSTKSKVTENKNGENVPHLKITEVVLVHCNIFNNDYQRDLRALHTSVPYKSFGQLLEISTNILYF